MPYPRATQASASDRNRRNPLLFFTAVFVIVTCIGLIAMQALNSWHDCNVQLQETRVATINMAKTLSSNSENTFKLADTVLVDVIERLEQDGTGAVPLARLHTVLQMHTKEIPLLDGIFVFGEHGQMYVNSQTKPIPNLNNADREYFIFHHANSERGPHIGVPLRSRTTGDWIIPISRRFNHADGSFAGVVVAAIKLAHFKQMYESIDVGNTGTIFLALDNGTLLLRRPFKENEITANISDGPFFKVYRTKGPIGTAMLTSGMDNITRLYSYRHLDNYPLIVGAALSKKEILADWRTSTYHTFIGIGILVTALFLLGLYLIRQIRIREQVEAELRDSKRALERENLALGNLALHDGLTGLANRRQFESALNTEFKRAARSGDSISLVILDVDYFKQFNDLYGHPAGDECLRQIGDAIHASLNRAGDLAFRYGGEELGVLLPQTNLTGAIKIAEKIRCAVKNLKVPHSGNPAKVVTISGGVAEYVPGKEKTSPVDLIRAADKALYEAKAHGRNSICNEKITDLSMVFPTASEY
jgi:diguanylate cyclase (GGDEF)-like protein